MSYLFSSFSKSAERIYLYAYDKKTPSPLPRSIFSTSLFGYPLEQLYTTYLFRTFLPFARFQILDFSFTQFVIQFLRDDFSVALHFMRYVEHIALNPEFS